MIPSSSPFSNTPRQNNYYRQLLYAENYLSNSQESLQRIGIAAGSCAADYGKPLHFVNVSEIGTFITAEKKIGWTISDLTH